MSTGWNQALSICVKYNVASLCYVRPRQHYQTFKLARKLYINSYTLYISYKCGVVEVSQGGKEE
jgi:hypothetical protein